MNGRETHPIQLKNTHTQLTCPIITFILAFWNVSEFSQKEKIMCISSLQLAPPIQYRFIYTTNLPLLVSLVDYFIESWSLKRNLSVNSTLGSYLLISLIPSFSCVQIHSEERIKVLSSKQSDPIMYSFSYKQTRQAQINEGKLLFETEIQ